MIPSVELVLGLTLVLVRTSSLLVAVPGFGHATIPMRVRAGLAMVLALAGWLGVGAPPALLEGNALVTAAIAEALFGLTAGLGARLVLEAASAAGAAADLGAGLSFASIVDPLGGTVSTPIAQLLHTATLLTATAMGIHREAVSWLLTSLVRLPPGSAEAGHDLAARLVGGSLYGIELGIRLAFPLLAVATGAQLVLGVITRQAPQLGLQGVGFSVSILATGAALSAAAPPVAHAAASAAIAMLHP